MLGDDSPMTRRTWHDIHAENLAKISDAVREISDDAAQPEIQARLDDLADEIEILTDAQRRDGPPAQWTTPEYEFEVEW